MKCAKTKTKKEKRTLSRCLYLTESETKIIIKEAKRRGLSVNGYIVHCSVTFAEFAEKTKP